MAMAQLKPRSYACRAIANAAALRPRPRTCAHCLHAAGSGPIGRPQCNCAPIELSGFGPGAAKVPVPFPHGPAASAWPAQTRVLLERAQKPNSPSRDLHTHETVAALIEEVTAPATCRDNKSLRVRENERQAGHMLPSYTWKVWAALNLMAANCAKAHEPSSP